LSVLKLEVIELKFNLELVDAINTLGFFDYYVNFYLLLDLNLN